MSPPDSSFGREGAPPLRATQALMTGLEGVGWVRKPPTKGRGWGVVWTTPYHLYMSDRPVIKAWGSPMVYPAGTPR